MSATVFLVVFIFSVVAAATEKMMMRFFERGLQDASLSRSVSASLPPELQTLICPMLGNMGVGVLAHSSPMMRFAMRLALEVCGGRDGGNDGVWTTVRASGRSRRRAPSFEAALQQPLQQLPVEEEEIRQEL